MCTFRFNTESSEFYPCNVLALFRLTPTMNSHFFPPSRFNRLVFLMEAYCVLCEVRTKFLYIVTSSSSPRRPGFDPRPVYVRFVFAKLALRQVFLRVYTSVFPYQCHFTSFIHMLLLLRQMHEAWEPFKKQLSFGRRGAFDRNVLSFFFLCGETLFPGSQYASGRP